MHRLLTYDECDTFLTKHLKFSNWKTVLDTDKIKFLQIFVKKHVEQIGYQNVTMALIDLKKRDCPTIEQIIQTGLLGIGGLCLELNIFSKILLSSLQFNTFSIAATCTSVAVPNNHCITVVQISSNELYLIDVGQAQPVSTAIPLHQLPFRGQILGYPYEYRWCEQEKVYARFHIKGRVAIGPFKDKEEDKFSTFTLEPRDFDYFIEPMAIIYKDSERFNLRGLFLSRFFDDEDELNHLKEEKINFVIAFGKNIYSGNVENRYISKFDCYLDMIPQLKIYFPKLTENMLKAAFPNFNI